MMTSSESETSLVPSETVSVNVTVVSESTWGAVNEGERVSLPERVIRPGWLWDHE